MSPPPGNGAPRQGPLSSVRPAIWGIEPYKPGKPIAEVQRELGIADVVKLASNENPLGPSQKAVAAVREAVAEGHLYPEPTGYLLRRAVSAAFRVAEPQILLGNGANELIELLAHTFLDPGDEMVQSDASFAMYPVAAQLMGARAVTVPCLPGWRHDLEAMADAVTARTRIVFVCNPNNPTGTLATRDELSAFLACIPDRVVVCVDEAYHEFVEDPSYPDTIAWLPRYPNLVILRSMSKIYGLAGLRVGYGFAHAEVAAVVDRVREPFNVNSLAQAAGAAALSDTEHVRRTLENNRSGRRYLLDELSRLGLRVTPSHTNFLLVELGRPASPVFDALLARGVVVRPMTGRIADAVRVSVGTPEQNRRLVAALAGVLSATVSG